MYPVMKNDTHPQLPYPGVSSTIIPRAATVVLRPRPTAPAPTTASGRAPAILCPVPVGEPVPQLGMNFPYGRNQLILQTSMVPSHAAGSQGRGGILSRALDTSLRQTAGMAQDVDWICHTADAKVPLPAL